MKQQAIQYLAFDVHQATIVATLRNEQGTIVMKATVATEAKAILALVQSAGPRVHVAFEEGTQAQWLHDLLIEHAERVIVCNVRGHSEVTNKSDRIDADQLSELLLLGALKSVYHGSPEILTLKELMRCYICLLQDSTRVILRIKAIFRTSGHSYAGRIGLSALPAQEVAGQTRDWCPVASGTSCASSGRVLTIGAIRSVRADCKGEDRKAISKEENRP